MDAHFSFLFPGQGSQSVGMLAEFSSHCDSLKELFDQASAILGYDLWALTQDGPLDQLNTTEFTQPALLVADVALWRCWQKANAPLPSVMAGHSLGEYSALVCAGALPFEDAVSLVAARGKYMQAAVSNTEGAMAAILGLDDDKVRELCEENADGAVLEPANFNSIGQVVIAGDKAAVERAVAAAKEKGAKLAKLIPVSVPSHCSLMQPACDALKNRLNEVIFTAPTIPVIQNVDVTAHQDPELIRAALIAQLISPVRWVETIQSMMRDGVTTMIECGPGKVLAGLNKRISKELVTYRVGTPELFNDALKNVGGEAVCL